MICIYSKPKLDSDVITNRILELSQDRLAKQLFIVFLVLMISFTGIAKKVYASTTPKEEQITKLEKKISKGYSRKFCNAIGMGMSKESSLRLAIEENSNPMFNSSLWMELAISGDKNINDVEENKLVKLISTEVVETCGYPLQLSGEKGIKEFANILQNELAKEESS